MRGLERSAKRVNNFSRHLLLHHKMEVTSILFDTPDIFILDGLHEEALQRET